MVRIRQIGPLFAIAMVLAACTERSRARNWGGTETNELPTGMKLLSVSWKGEELWVHMRPMRGDEAPETHTYRQIGKYGVLSKEGQVILHEKPALPETR